MKILLAALTVLGLSLATAPASAAINYYISTPFSGSCSTSQTAPGYIETSSFSISGVDPVGTSNVGPSSGKLALGDLMIEKGFDSCSGSLVTSFLSQQNLSTLTLIGMQTLNGSTKGGTILSITLTNPVISSYKLDHGEERPTEDISFRYSKVCVTSSPAGAKSTTVCYDSSTNTVTR